MIMILIFITVLLFRFGSEFLPCQRHLNEDEKCQVNIFIFHDQMGGTPR